MRLITTDQLAHMEVINLCDGARLGYPTAVEFDADDGCVKALLVPTDGGLFSLGKPPVYRIPRCRIECIGEDTVLIKMTAAELSECLQGKKKR